MSPSTATEEPGKRNVTFSVFSLFFLFFRKARLSKMSGFGSAKGKEGRLDRVSHCARRLDPPRPLTAVQGEAQVAGRGRPSWPGSGAGCPVLPNASPHRALRTRLGLRVPVAHTRLRHGVRGCPPPWLPPATHTWGLWGAVSAPVLCPTSQFPPVSLPAVWPSASTSRKFFLVCSLDLRRHRCATPENMLATELETRVQIRAPHQ